MALSDLFIKKKGNEEFYKFFQNVLGFTPRRTETYEIAFIHRSMSREIMNGHYRVNNERLEYLGDAVLETIVSEYLYKKYPYQGEGFLTEMRSKLVSRATLNKLAIKIGLIQLIQYNRESQGLFKSVPGDAFEALTGAIYLERGYRFTRKVIVNRIMNIYLDIDAVEHTDWNYKSKLINWGQRSHKKVSFEVLRTMYSGRHGESRKEYECQVVIDGEPQEKAVEYSIKAAEQLCAEKTWKKLEEAGIIIPENKEA